MSLCHELDCQPGDLLEFREDGGDDEDGETDF